MTQTPKKQEKVAKSRKMYWKRWINEQQMELYFLVSGGYPRCAKTGKKVMKPVGGRLRKTDASIHHEIPLKGTRPSGRANRQVQWMRDLPIISLVSKKAHDEIHMARERGEEDYRLNAFLTGEIVG